MGDYQHAIENHALYSDEKVLNSSQNNFWLVMKKVYGIDRPVIQLCNTLGAIENHAHTINWVMEYMIAFNYLHYVVSP